MHSSEIHDITHVDQFLLDRVEEIANRKLERMGILVDAQEAKRREIERVLQKRYELITVLNARPEPMVADDLYRPGGVGEAYDRSVITHEELADFAVGNTESFRTRTERGIFIYPREQIRKYPDGRKHTPYGSIQDEMRALLQCTEHGETQPGEGHYHGLILRAKNEKTLGWVTWEQMMKIDSRMHDEEMLPYEKKLEHYLCYGIQGKPLQYRSLVATDYETLQNNFLKGIPLRDCVLFDTIQSTHPFAAIFLYFYMLSKALEYNSHAQWNFLYILNGIKAPGGDPMAVGENVRSRGLFKRTEAQQFALDFNEESGLRAEHRLGDQTIYLNPEWTHLVANISDALDRCTEEIEGIAALVRNFRIQSKEVSSSHLPAIIRSSLLP